MDGQAVAVPKFASFKPKKALNENDGLSESMTGSIVQSHGSKHRRDRQSRGSHHQHRHHHRPRTEGRRVVKDVEVKGDDTVKVDEAASPTLYDDRLFIIDKTGDEKNLVYGSIHRYSVPKFRRYGNGGVLGCSKSMKIDRDWSDEKGIVLSDHRNYSPAKREKYVFAKGEKHQERLLKFRPSVQGPNTSLDADFLPLSAGKKRKRIEVDDGFSSNDDHKHYRSIEGRAKDGDHPLNPEFQYVTDLSASEPEDGLELDLDSITRTKTRDLSRRVEEHPQELAAWLDLIDHQDKLLGLGKDGPRKVTQAEKRSTADIKIHIYEKALRLMNPSSTLSLERLSIGLMDEGAKVWDIEKQSRRWEDITKAYPISVTLWKKFINFKQTNFTTFNYDEHRKLFSSRIDLLRSLILKGNHSASELVKLCESVVYTLIRGTVFIREAGYPELALAIWQGFLEYNIFYPPNMSQPKIAGLFRDFWESEVPRIGEDHSKGWHAYFQDSSSSSVPDPRSDQEFPEVLISNNKLMFERWAITEQQRSKDSKEPARTLDDVTENDPYRVILFDDIEPFLLRLPEDVQPDELVSSAFLAFCQLPQAPISSKHSFKAWREDSFLRTEILDYERILLQDYLGTSNGEQSQDFEVYSRFPFHNFVHSTDNLFAGSKWVKSLQPWASVYGKGSGPVKYQWIRNALRAISTRSSRFAEYFLAFEFANEPQSIKKTAKDLLKRYPSSLALYNVWAMIEWNRGNTDAAKNVFYSAIGMSTSMSDDERNENVLLHKSMLWALLEDGRSSEAFQHLLRTPEASPAAILKTKQELLASRDHSVSTVRTSLAVMQTELLAILEYYTASLGTRLQGDIVASFSVFERFSDVLSQRGLGVSNDHELLHQSAARLLYFHASSGPYRPAFLREKLTYSLTLFPQNTLLLSLFAWNESRLLIDRKVRSILLSTILIPGTIMSHIFAIRHEIRHGNVHSQHAAFEKAVSDDSETKSNPGVWRLYLLWCLRTGKFEGKVKDVFYRGMVACPWAKEFMMLAFQELKGRMGLDELKGLYKILVEKELRIHVDLDELMEG